MSRNYNLCSLPELCVHIPKPSFLLYSLSVEAEGRLHFNYLHECVCRLCLLLLVLVSVQVVVNYVNL
jgi:hypothetical protein